MKAPEDLHPDDRAARINLRDMLIERRYDLGLSQRALGDLIGIQQQAVTALEAAETWRMRTVQRWTRHLGARLILRPTDLPGPDLDAVDAFRPADPDRADTWDQQALIGALTEARVSLGVRHVDLAALLGVKDRAIGSIENPEAGLMFVTPQRYCRALGGSLAVGLEDA